MQSQTQNKDYSKIALIVPCTWSLNIIVDKSFPIYSSYMTMESIQCILPPKEFKPFNTFICYIE